MRRTDNKLFDAAHIVDSSVCEYEKYAVLVQSLHLLSVLVERMNDGTEVSRASQSDVIQTLSIGSKDTGYAKHRRLLSVSIQREAVVDLAWLERGDGTEAERREHACVIVRLKNIAHLIDSLHILVLGAIEVERSSLLRITVRSSEVNSAGK